MIWVIAVFYTVVSILMLTTLKINEVKIEKKLIFTMIVLNAFWYVLGVIG